MNTVPALVVCRTECWKDCIDMATLCLRKYASIWLKGTALFLPTAFWSRNSKVSRNGSFVGNVPASCRASCANGMGVLLSIIFLAPTKSSTAGSVTLSDWLARVDQGYVSNLFRNMSATMKVICKRKVQSSSSERPG